MALPITRLQAEPDVVGRGRKASIEAAKGAEFSPRLGALAQHWTRPQQPEFLDGN
jgi:hypothetical protein